VESVSRVELISKTNLPKPIPIRGTISPGPEFEDKPSRKRKVDNLFTSLKKTIENWTSNDFINYFKTKYSNIYGHVCTVYPKDRRNMTNLIDRIGTNTLKEHIDNFFLVAKNKGMGQNYIPSWNAFFSTDVQQKLDHFRFTGEWAGYNGKLGQNSQVEVRCNTEKAKKTEEYVQIQDEMMTIDLINSFLSDFYKGTKYLKENKTEKARGYVLTIGEELFKKHKYSVADIIKYKGEKNK